MFFRYHIADRGKTGQRGHIVQTVTLEVQMFFIFEGNYKQYVKKQMRDLDLLFLWYMTEKWEIT